MSLQESIESVKAEIKAAEEEKKRQEKADELALVSKILEKIRLNGKKFDECRAMLEESQISGLFDDFNNDHLGSIGTFSEAANLVEKTKSFSSPAELTEYTYALYLRGVVNGVPVQLMAQAYIADRPDDTGYNKAKPPHLIIQCLHAEDKKPGFMDKILRKKFEKKTPSQRCLWTKALELEKGVPLAPGVVGDIKEWQNLSLVSRYFAEILVEQKVV